MLALDTSGRHVSVALALSDAMHCAVGYERTGHSQHLLELIDEVLISGQVDRCQLQAVAVVHGPGSFTGLRVAVSVAQGIALGLNCKVIAVDSLLATAQHALGIEAPVAGSIILVAFDARLDEVYGAAYRWCPAKAAKPAGFETLVEPQVSSSNALALRLVQCLAQSNKEASLPVIAAGNAWPTFAELSDLANARGWPVRSDVFARADAVARCAVRAGQSRVLGDLSELSPLYLRNKVALNSKEQEALRYRKQFAPLRALALSDLPALMTIEQDVYEFPWTEGNFRDALTSGYDVKVLYEARDPTALAGYFVVMRILDEVHLLNLSVARSWQKKGLGRWLLCTKAASH